MQAFLRFWVAARERRLGILERELQAVLIRVIGWSFQHGDHRWNAVASLIEYEIFKLPPLRGLQVLHLRMRPMTMHLLLRNEKEVCNNLLSRLENSMGGSTDKSYVPPALLNCHMHEVTKQGHR